MNSENIKVSRNGKSLWGVLKSAIFSNTNNISKKGYFSNTQLLREKIALLKKNNINNANVNSYIKRLVSSVYMQNIKNTNQIANMVKNISKNSSLQNEDLKTFVAQIQKKIAEVANQYLKILEFVEEHKNRKVNDNPLSVSKIISSNHVSTIKEILNLLAKYYEAVVQSKKTYINKSVTNFKTNETLKSQKLKNQKLKKDLNNHAKKFTVALNNVLKNTQKKVNETKTIQAIQNISEKKTNSKITNSKPTVFSNTNSRQKSYMNALVQKPNILTNQMKILYESLKIPYNTSKTYNFNNLQSKAALLNEHPKAKEYILTKYSKEEGIVDVNLNTLKNDVRIYEIASIGSGTVTKNTIQKWESFSTNERKTKIDNYISLLKFADQAGINQNKLKTFQFPNNQSLNEFDKIYLALEDERDELLGIPMIVAIDNPGGNKNGANIRFNYGNNANMTVNCNSNKFSNLTLPKKIKCIFPTYLKLPAQGNTPIKKIVTAFINKNIPRFQERLQRDKPTTFLLFGASGSGKTHFAENIFNTFLTNNNFQEAERIYKGGCFTMSVDQSTEQVDPVLGISETSGNRKIGQLSTPYGLTHAWTPFNPDSSRVQTIIKYKTAGRNNTVDVVDMAGNENVFDLFDAFLPGFEERKYEIINSMLCSIVRGTANQMPHLKLYINKSPKIAMVVPDEELSIFTLLNDDDTRKMLAERYQQIEKQAKKQKKDAIGKQKILPLELLMNEVKGIGRGVAMFKKYLTTQHPKKLLYLDVFPTMKQHVWYKEASKAYKLLCYVAFRISEGIYITSSMSLMKQYVKSKQYILKYDKKSNTNSSNRSFSSINNEMKNSKINIQNSEKVSKLAMDSSIYSHKLQVTQNDLNQLKRAKAFLTTLSQKMNNNEVFSLQHINNKISFSNDFIKYLSTIEQLALMAVLYTGKSGESKRKLASNSLDFIKDISMV